MEVLSYNTYLQLKASIKGYERLLTHPLTPEAKKRIKAMMKRAKEIAVSFEVLEMSDKYILVDGKPTREENLIKWAMWFENDANRFVAKDTIGEFYISTVFIGLDHRDSEDEDPLLWETLVRAPKFEEMQRYTSLEAARDGHSKYVIMAKTLTEHLNESKKEHDNGADSIGDK